MNQGITALNHQDTITLQPVRCMGACSQACVVAFAAPNKFTLILSGLSSTDSVADLLKFSAQYMACADGKVPFKERPDTVNPSSKSPVDPKFFLLRPESPTLP